MSRRRTTPARTLAAVGLAGILAFAATGCGDGGENGAGSGDPTVVDITFDDGQVTPSGERVEVGVGDPIDLKVTADEPGTLHIHSTPEQELDYPQGTKTFEVEIDRPGVVVVESHELDVTVVQLEVR